MKRLLIVALLVVAARLPIGEWWDDPHTARTPTPTRRVRVMRPTLTQTLEPYPAPPLGTPVPGHYPAPPVEPTVDWSIYGPTATPEQ